MNVKLRDVLKVSGFFGFGTENVFVRFSINLWFLVCVYLHNSHFKTRPWNAKVIIFTRWAVNISIINCCFGKASKAGSWEHLLRTLDDLEKNRPSVHRATSMILLAIMNVCLFISDFIDMYKQRPPATFVAFSILFLGDFYALLLSIITQHILSLIAFHYVSLNEDLRNNITITSERGDREAEQAIHEIGSIYYSLHCAIKHFNNVFRWGLFFNLFGFVAQDLMPIGYLIHSISSEERILLKFAVWSILMRAIYVNFNMLLCVLISEKVERSGTILDETCHKLLLKINNEGVREELLALSESIRVLSPKVSAAGFLDVNQKVLPGMVSLITTYAIVDAQFELK